MFAPQGGSMRASSAAYGVGIQVRSATGAAGKCNDSPTGGAMTVPHVGYGPPSLDEARVALDEAERADAPPNLISERREHFVEMANLRSVQLLARGELQAALRLLNETWQMVASSSNSPLAAITANNLACYYRRRGKLDQALAQLRRASAIEARCANPRGPADTQINLCVVLSELGQHEYALAHAAEALRLIEAEAAATAAAGRPLPAERAAVHASALHNMAVQQAKRALKSFPPLPPAPRTPPPLSRKSFPAPPTCHSFSAGHRRAHLVAARSIEALLVCAVWASLAPSEPSPLLPSPWTRSGRPR